MVIKSGVVTYRHVYNFNYCGTVGILITFFSKEGSFRSGFECLEMGIKDVDFYTYCFNIYKYVLLTGGIAPRKIRVDGPHKLLRTTSSDHRCFQEDRIPPSPISWSFFDRNSSKVMYTTFFISNIWKIIEKKSHFKQSQPAYICNGGGGVVNHLFSVHF